MVVHGTPSEWAAICRPDGDGTQPNLEGPPTQAKSRRRGSSSVRMAAAASIVGRRPGLDEAFHRDRKADAVERSQSIDAIDRSRCSSRDQVMLPAESRARSRGPAQSTKLKLQPRPDLGHLRWTRSAEPGLAQVRPHDAVNVAVVNGRKLAQERKPVRRRGRHEHADGVLESC